MRIMDRDYFFGRIVRQKSCIRDYCLCAHTASAVVCFCTYICISTAKLQENMDFFIFL